MLAHTADRQQLGSSPGFTFQEVGVCVVPMNQEETRSLEIFDIVYSAFKPIHAEPTVQCVILLKFSLSQLTICLSNSLTNLKILKLQIAFINISYF